MLWRNETIDDSLVDSLPIESVVWEVECPFMSWLLDQQCCN